MPEGTASCVYLVGAGPGDPGLISLRAVECLKQADLVLYDGLVNPLLLRHTHGQCERTARVRRDGTTIVQQDQINQRLIDEARAGRTVVRLKGGDPYIFGRGSEEADALQAAGIAFEVVPGITAATAAAEYAGFSFTHRQISSAVAFVTGHEDPARECSRLDFDALARFPGTLVFYMGLNRLAEICAQLIQHGMSDQTAAAVVCQASLPGQRVVSGTVKSLPGLAVEAGLKPPSLIVIGECVRQRNRHSWFEQLPLFGQSIGITRPRHQADEIADQIARQGGEPVLMPMIRVCAVDDEQAEIIRQQLTALDDYRWLIFTSVNGVDEFFRHLWLAGLDNRSVGHTRLAAIGSSTSAALAARGLRADVVPETFRAESLAEALIPLTRGQKVLWVRATRGRDVLPQMLTEAGACVDQLVVYQNTDIEEFDPTIVSRLKNGTLSWVTVSSPSIARQLAEMLKRHQIDPGQLTTRLAAISPVTSAAARESGLEISAEATQYTWNGLLDAIIRCQT